jgi:hypothetical protein
VRTFIISASLVLALTQAGLAEGEEDSFSGNAVMPGCRSLLEERQAVWFKEGQCLGIIRGLADSFYLPPPSPFCVPHGATNEQMVRVVVSYIDRHPEKMHLNFTNLAYNALREAWPCKP